MNKNLILILALITISISCTQTKQGGQNSAKNEFIEIEYPDKINGFEVSALWKPMFNIKFEQNIYAGPAIITFKNGENKFTITHEFFTQFLDSSQINFDKKNDEIINILTSKIINKNEDFDSETFGEKITTPGNFFFSDVNFDGIKDLILEEKNNGQRETTKFRVILRAQNSEIDNTMYSYRPSLHEPLNELDDYSKIDRAKKQIVKFGDGGFCQDVTEIYQSFINQETEDFDFKLIKSYETEPKIGNGENGCVEKEYLYVPQTKKLVSTKELKNEL